MSIKGMEEDYNKLIMARDGCDKLTQKEIDIMTLATTGLKREEIGAKIGISKNTVAVHLNNIFNKTSSRNIVEAINHFNKFYK